MSAEPTSAAEGGALTIDQAISVLRTEPEAVEHEAPADDTEDSDEPAPEGDDVDEESEPEAEPTAEGDDEPDTDEDPAAEVEEEEPESEPDDSPAIAAPQFWDEKSKAAFAKAPREVQEAITATETERVKAVNSALETAADARKRADTELEALTKVKADVETILPKLLAQFADEFAGVDWEAEAEADPEGTTAKWIKKQAQEQRIKSLQTAQAATEQAEQSRYIAEQRELMATHAPLLNDPKFGPRLATDLTEYLTAQGETPEAIRLISAPRAGLALKAMLYDRAIAQAEAATKAPAAPKPVTKTAPKNAAPAPAKVVRVSAAPAARSPRQSSLEAAERSLDRSGSISAGLAVLRARRNTKGR